MGEAGPNPTPPEPDRSSPAVWELRLGYVVVPTGSTDLSSATVTNEKGLEFCPFAAPFEEIDVSGIVSDFKVSANEALTLLLAYFDRYEEMVASAVDGTTAGQLQNQIEELRNQVESIDFGGSVDGKTIVYSIEGGELEKKLRVNEEGIKTEHLADESVTDAKMANDSVTSRSIKNESVTLEKLSRDVQDAITASTPLELISWERIKEISDDQSYDAEFLSTFVGQTKKVEISGYGTFNFQCIGVRHDEKSDGSGKAGFTFMSVEVVENRNMNGDPINNGGWALTEMKTWFDENLIKALPSDLQSAISTVKKEYRTYKSSGDGDLFTSNDKLWIASLKEVHGSEVDGGEGEWYEYFLENNNAEARVKKYANSTATWWLRTVFSTTDFYQTANTGYSAHEDANQLRGAVPCFCV